MLCGKPLPLSLTMRAADIIEGLRLPPPSPLWRWGSGKQPVASGFHPDPGAYVQGERGAGIGEQKGGDLRMGRRQTTLRMLILASLLLGSLITPGLYAGEWGPYESEGTIVGIMPEQGFILLDHEPIRAPGYFMGKMEMPFTVSDPALMNGLKAGDRIHFRVSEEKKSRIVELRKLP
jgi:Cu/Ag efflux protein CusF